MSMRAGAIMAMLMLGAVPARAQAPERAAPLPALHTNMGEIAELLRESPIAVYDPLAVFKYVLARLPDRVQVYPTENYFYFYFTQKGVRYSGNVRLGANDRDQGKITIAYSEQPTDWNPNPRMHRALLGAEQGVAVEKLEPLIYRVSHAGKSVAFALNDLSQVKPPAGFLQPDEMFIGPVFDESGIRFFLIFNGRLKVFHFILDETAPVMDQFTPLGGNGRIAVGKRTGFAFYQFDSRKILVGVSRRESRLNTMYDGPFDQLPDNFVDGEALRDAIVAADPSVRGKIDRLGYFPDGSGRYLINPYMLYREAGDLAVFERCVASRAVPPANRAACFVIDDQEAQRKKPRPLALKLKKR